MAAHPEACASPPGFFFSRLVVTACAIEAGHRFGLFREVHRRSFKRARRQIRMLTMAAETPTHRERSELLDPVHGLYRPMTTLAWNIGENMLAVVEIDKVREIVNLHPLDGALLLDRLLQFLDFGCLFFQHAVAVHAHAGWRNTGMTAGACSKVTILASNLVIAGVDLVWKRNGLFGRVSLMDSDARKPPQSQSCDKRQADCAESNQ